MGYAILRSRSAMLGIDSATMNLGGAQAHFWARGVASTTQILRCAQSL